MSHEMKSMNMTAQVVDVATLRCNKCGETISEAKRQEDDGVIAYTVREVECFSAEVRWGYWSQKDTERHEWELCERCYDAFVATFAIPPKITGYM